MGAYQEAYEKYLTACEDYGMESINIERFIQQLTKEQLHEYLKHA